MVAYEKEIEVFFHKSSQLLEAFPSARMTTKYRKVSETQAFITAKTYDPASGAIVKFKTDKTVDLGRLMVGSGRLSGTLAGVKDDEASLAGTSSSDVEMKTDKASATEEQIAAVDTNAQPTTTTTTSSSKKKKKKGKK